MKNLDELERVANAATQEESTRIAELERERDALRADLRDQRNLTEEWMDQANGAQALYEEARDEVEALKERARRAEELEALLEEALMYAPGCEIWGDGRWYARYAALDEKERE